MFAKQPIKARLSLVNKPSNILNYSADGANWQESALQRVTKGSEAWKAIGRLVTSIHNGDLTVSDANVILNGLIATGK